MAKNDRENFSGYVTRYGVKCSDGATIRHGAFSGCNGTKVPLVWQHLHDDPKNILGYVLLEERNDGVYGKAYFNGSPEAESARQRVEHGDISSLSIHANHVSRSGSVVDHGKIREVSLVIGGANPRAGIESVILSHADGSRTELEDECIIYGDTITHADDSDEKKSVGGEKTVREVYDSLTDDQKALFALVLEQGGSIKQSDEGDDPMKNNPFDGGGVLTHADGTPHLTHSDAEVIFRDAVEMGSLQKSILYHADEMAQKYGIENIEILFPDAKLINKEPTFIKRRTEWVSTVIDGTKHLPFTRIKMTFADITADEARAKGYIKGNKKVEEVIKVAKRTIEPTTVYKKQKLDRDDILDITDFDVVNWLWSEMRLMLEEELARAILIGDGRDISDPDHINDEKIRPIIFEDDLFIERIGIPINESDWKASIIEFVDTVAMSMQDYEGAGTPTLFINPTVLARALTLRNRDDVRLYKTAADMASEMNVGKVVPVPLMKNPVKVPEGSGYDSTEVDFLGIVVNLNDYAVGTDKGGEITKFDDFDIDYNQYKYLLETRISGGLVTPKCGFAVYKSSAARSRIASTPATASK